MKHLHCGDKFLFGSPMQAVSSRLLTTPGRILTILPGLKRHQERTNSISHDGFGKDFPCPTYFTLETSAAMSALKFSLCTPSNLLSESAGEEMRDLVVPSSKSCATRMPENASLNCLSCSALFALDRASLTLACLTLHFCCWTSSNAARISFCEVTAVQVLRVLFAVSVGCLRTLATAAPTEDRLVQVTGAFPEP
jgi:hypothetical protein